MSTPEIGINPKNPREPAVDSNRLMLWHNCVERLLSLASVNNFKSIYEIVGGAMYSGVELGLQDYSGYNEKLGVLGSYGSKDSDYLVSNYITRAGKFGSVTLASHYDLRYRDDGASYYLDPLSRFSWSLRRPYEEDIIAPEEGTPLQPLEEEICRQLDDDFAAIKYYHFEKVINLTSRAMDIVAGGLTKPS